MKRRIALARITQAALAATLFTDKAHVSRLANGVVHPTPEMADRIDNALNAAGELSALAGQRTAAAPADLRRPMDDTDIGRLHDTVQQLVSLDTMHGSEGLHTVAARAFRNAHRQLATAGAAPGTASDLHAAIAEVGEVAAWLAYDSEHQQESRQVATEALLVAQLAGDRSMERFLLSHLSMQAVYLGRGAEGLQIADRVLAEAPKSGRVVGMLRVRRARALGELGDRTEALAELERARGELAGGIGPNDPAWTWWLHEAELAVHEARLLAATDDGRGAVRASQLAVAALPDRQGRDQALYRAWLLHDLVNVRGWRDAERVAEDLMAKAPVVGSARVPKILRGAVRAAERGRAPRWAVEAIRAAEEAA
jgi:transcriptional regulator with XRE-family HTH domain